MNHNLILNAEQFNKRRRRRSNWRRLLSVMACIVVFCTTYALILPAITMVQGNYCGMDEHTHTEECYVQVEEQAVVLSCTCESLGVHQHSSSCYDECGDLVCQLADFVVHTHNSLCTDADGNLVCTLPEISAHIHTDACYAAVQAETQESHVHTDACYTNAKGELNCLLTDDAHVHTDECYLWEQQLTCELEETAATEPTESAEPQLICTEPVAVEHIHTDSCFRSTTEPALTCKLEEGDDHSHSALCYGTWQLVCEIKEHTHWLACYSNPDADVENSDAWEKSISHVELTGVWSEDVLAIAQSQLGYSESTENYLVEEDGETIRGYTRYGAWYGDAYGKWDAMFASFCLHYAGVENVPLNSDPQLWREELAELDLYRKREDYTPRIGDLVFFDKNWDGLADSVGIVAEIITDEEKTVKQVKAVKGDSDNSVRYVTYDADDLDIIGYGDLPGCQVKQVVVCGMDAHVHIDTCCDEQGNLICDIEEHSHSGDCIQHKVIYSDDLINALVTVDGAQNLPDDLTLKILPVSQEEDPAVYGSMQVALSEKMVSDSQFIGAASFYNIQLLLNGEAYELPDGVDVSVDVSFTEPVFNPEEVADSVGVHTYILTPDTMESADSADAPTEEIATFALMSVADEDETASKETAEIYQAEAAEEEVFRDVEQGVTALSYQTDGLAAFAVALATENQTGEFWTRVTSTSELAAGGTFMIVSAEGNYALRGDNSNNYTPVTLQTVKGNVQYYTISGSDDTNVRWTFSGSGSSYTIRNQGTSNYVYLDSVRSSWWQSTEYIIYSSSKTLTLSYVTPENCWRIANGNYYLRNQGTGAFSRTNSSDGSYGSSATYYYTRDMLIFKLSDVTELEIPPDVDGSSSSTGSTETAPEKPDYGDFITPSGGKTGDTAVVDLDDSTISVSGKYYSDNATSNIESEFRKEDIAENKTNDGKVLTDKSVIYGDDDYDAFDSYGKNLFGITLSALGQEYEIPYQDVVRTPVDVVFVLDVSGSMTTNGTTDTGTDGRDSTRASAMTEAVNDAIKHIMDDHDENRIGIVLYSGGAWEMLPLDRYTATNDEYLVCNDTTKTHSPTNYSLTIKYVTGSSSLKNEDGVSFAGVGSDAVQGLGTYTQAGIAMGRKVFEDIGTDTTYTTTIGEGDNVRNYTVSRQPVFILLSDGEPTYSTNIYMDVLNGPHYGDGNGGSTNAKGIHGYNTILSANYYKRMVAIQYDTPALFYTIGMGINTPEQGDGPQVDGSNTGDNYKRAVLNPTYEIINNLTSTLNASTTTEQLKSLMLGTFDDQAVSTRSEWPEKWTGIPHIYTPVLQGNPYADSYSYADGAYFGKLTSDDLKKIFNEIIESSLKVSPYGFILYRNSSVELTDYLGEGMEVKGIPVLRYGGQNYTNPTVTVNGNVTTYTYSGTFVDPYIPDRQMNLAEIRVTVTTDDNGNQVVDMYVPDTVLPTYTPELIGNQYYYESLPVRLIYQVGLTDEAEEQVLALQKTGGELTFYTNRWENESEIAISTLLPSTANPFYYDVDGDGTLPPYHEHHDMKADNKTNTLEYSVDCSMTTDTYDGDTITKVIHKLGNNGKLVFTVDTVKVPVEKVWQSADAEEMDPVDVSLYKITETTAEDGSVNLTATVVDTATLGNDNEWKHTFTGLGKPGEDWYYAIVETVPAGYRVHYSGETVEIPINNGASVVASKVDLSDLQNVLVTLTNSPAVELPATGGSGTILYTTGGLLIMLLAVCVLLYNQNLRRRKEEMKSS